MKLEACMHKKNARTSQASLRDLRGNKKMAERCHVTKQGTLHSTVHTFRLRNHETSRKCGFPRKYVKIPTESRYETPVNREYGFLLQAQYMLVAPGNATE